MKLATTYFTHSTTIGFISCRFWRIFMAVYTTSLFCLLSNRISFSYTYFAITASSIIITSGFFCVFVTGWAMSNFSVHFCNTASVFYEMLFCRDCLKMLWINTRLIMTQVMYIMSLWDCSIMDNVTILVNKITFFIYSNSAIAHLTGKSNPLPTSIRKNFITISEIFFSRHPFIKWPSWLDTITFENITNCYGRYTELFANLFYRVYLFIRLTYFQFLFFCNHNTHINIHYKMVQYEN